MRCVGEIVLVSSSWVAVLTISPAVTRKLWAKHGIDPGEVRQAIICQPGLRFVWHDHPERGLRAIVQIRLRGEDARVVLYPASDIFGGTWRVGSAYFNPRKGVRATMGYDESFYEDDEDAVEVFDVFERGEKHVTAEPVLGVNDYLSPWLSTYQSADTTAAADAKVTLV